MRERLLLHGEENGGGLRLIGFHELLRAGVYKEVADEELSSLRAARGGFLRDLPGLQVKLTPGVSAALVSKSIRLTAEIAASASPRKPSVEIAARSSLFRFLLVAWRIRTPCARPRCHAAAVIQDADEGHAAVLNFYGDACCARVDGVFHQLMTEAGRSTTSPRRLSPTWRLSWTIFGMGTSFTKGSVDQRTWR